MSISYCFSTLMQLALKLLYVIFSFARFSFQRLFVFSELKVNYLQYLDCNRAEILVQLGEFSTNKSPLSVI